MVKRISKLPDIKNFLIKGLKAEDRDFNFVLEDLFDSLVKEGLTRSISLVSDFGSIIHSNQFNDNYESLIAFAVEDYGKLYVEDIDDQDFWEHFADLLSLFLLGAKISRKYFLVKDLGAEIRKTLKPDLALAKIYNSLRDFLRIEDLYFFKKEINIDEYAEKNYKLIFQNGESNNAAKIISQKEILDLNFTNPSKYSKFCFSKIRGREWGIFVASKSQSWSEEDFGIIEFFAEEIATVFSQYELHSESLTTAQREFLLNQITTRIRESLSIDQIIETAVQELAQVMSVESCALVILDHKMRGTLGHKVWCINSSFQMKSTQILYEILHSELRPSWIRPTVQKNEIEICHDENLKFLKNSKVKSIMCSGLFNDSKKELVGVLVINFYEQNRNWSYDEELLLEGACKQLEIALMQASIYQEAQQTKRQMALLHKLSNDIRDSLDVSIVLGQIAKGIGEVLGLSRCFVRQIKDDGSIIKTEEEFHAKKIIKAEDLLFSFEADWIKALQESKGSELLNISSERDIDDSKLRAIMQIIGLKSFLAVPLIARGKLLGTINVHQCDRERTFLPEEIEFIYRVSSEAAIALEHAALFDTINKFNKIDPDTDLYNKKYFRELAEKEIQKCKDNKQPISYILIDMDYLKEINDDKDFGGHQAGDEAIQILANVLSKSVRQTSVENINRRVRDLVGRFGGDEFMILLPNTSIENAVKVSERIVNNLKKTKHSTWPKSLTCSIGISGAPENNYDYEELKNSSDKALYLSKDKGRNSITSTLEL